MLFPNLSFPQMPFFCHLPALWSSAVLSPGSSIKLSQVLLRSAAHGLSHRCTVRLWTGCQNSTRRAMLVSPFATHWCPIPGARLGLPQGQKSWATWGFLRSPCMPLFTEGECGMTGRYGNPRAESLEGCACLLLSSKSSGSFLLSTWNCKYQVVRLSQTQRFF